MARDVGLPSEYKFLEAQFEGEILQSEELGVRKGFGGFEWRNANLLTE